MHYIVKAAISVAIFLSFITGFAALYTYQLSDHFLFSTADKEPSYQETIKASISTLRERLAFEAKKYQLGTRQAFAKMSGDDELIVLLKEKFSENEMLVRFWNAENETLIYRLLANGPGAFGGSCNVRIAEYNGKTASKGDSTISCDFYYRRDGMSLEAQLFSVEPQQNTVFRDVLYPEQGIKEDLFYRMLYFSTVTATTLGFGEIVPLTNEARAWVAFESISGLLLMGTLVFWTTKKRGK